MKLGRELLIVSKVLKGRESGMRRKGRQTEKKKIGEHGQVDGLAINCCFCQPGVLWGER